MKMITRSTILLLSLSTLVWLSACERTLSGAEAAAVLAFSEPTTDNMLAGLTGDDYRSFSRDFDSDMYEELPAADFGAWKGNLDKKIGNYLSRNVERVTQADEFYVVFYRANFEKQDQVAITVAFHGSDHSIAQVSFDSENYSWSAFGYGQ